MIGRFTAVLALIAILAGIGSSAAAGTTIPALACDPVLYLCV
jgi:hypothetical protein